MHSVVTPPYVAGPLMLAPFRGLFLSPTQVGDPASVRLFGRPYRAAGERLDTWAARGRIRADAAPAVYLHEYTSTGITIRGFVGLLDVSRRATSIHEAVVLPHEGVHPAQVAELTDRMHEMGLNPAPILLAHRGGEATRRVVRGIQERPPDRQYDDRSGQRHRIWAVRGEDVLTELAAAWAGKQALLADGHHRYAAYLELQRRRPGGPASTGLAMLVDHDDTPLHLGAIHRVLSGLPLAGLEAALVTAGLSYRRGTAEEAVADLSPRHIVAGDGRRWLVIDLPSTEHPAVEVLHRDILDRLTTPPHHVIHVHTAPEALGKAGPRSTAVLLPAPSLDQVERVVLAGRLLPEKATSFQPKPSPGPLIRRLSDG